MQSLALHAQDPVHLIEKWRTSEGLKTPESVLFDTKNEVFYVSNINGKPLDKDDNGFIAKMGPDGTIIKAKWIKGLHAPKGMYLDGHMLYVTDIDRFVIIDTKKASIVKTIRVEEAT